MRLAEAQEIIREVDGKSYGWLKAWGLGWINEAIRTIQNRKSATDADWQIARNVRRKIARRW